jgi:hypothetical protein
MDAADTPNTSALPPPDEVGEHPAQTSDGWGYLGGSLVGVLAGGALIVIAAVGLGGGGGAGSGVLLALGILLALAALVIMLGLTAVAPKEARVLQLMGRYTGTVRTDGLRWVNPLTERHKVSVRVRNHETSVLKVNDANGNPIEIAAVVVWQVTDTAKAMFGVDEFVEFVNTQSETAVRHIAGGYAYDAAEGDGLSLRDNAEEITERLTREISERVAPAGVQILESRITHLAYAPEIAAAMLRRQQAGAVVAARRQIVEGSVGIVKSALDELLTREDLDLDEERRAAMVGNLLVVLCGDREAQPVINTGTLYH